MSIQQKQQFLRESILQSNINPNDFFQYWQQLTIELQDVDLPYLQKLVADFHSYRHDPHNSHHVQPQEQQEFTDFQGPEKNANHQQYADFNWDLLKQSSSSLSNHPPPPLHHSPQPKGKINNTTEDNEDSKNSKVQEMINNKNNQKIKSNELWIEELAQQGKRVGLMQIINSRPNEQKSLTVREVLQCSKLKSLKCLKLQQNILSHHNSNVQINIINVQQIEQRPSSLITKLIKNTTLQFTIKTIARNNLRAIGINWQVKRRPNDFQWLRNMLIIIYPGIVVPPLPSLPKSKDKLYGYQKKLQNFLLDCYRCPELKNSKYYEIFLSYSARNDFDSFVRNSQTSSKPKTLNHILNMAGIVQTLYSDNIEKYGLGLQSYLSRSSQHLKQVKNILNNINEAYDQISQSYKSLATVFFQMAQQSHSFSNQKCYERLANTYKQIALLSGEHSNFCQSEKQFIDAFLQSHFAYQKDRLDNMQSLITKRDFFAMQFSKRVGEEENKVGMLGKIASFFGEKVDYVDTPSSNYETLSIQVGYYNNQLLRESIRCIEVMVESNINHFSGYGHSRIDSVDKMQKTWSHILVQLSKLNLLK